MHAICSIHRHAARAGNAIIMLLINHCIDAVGSHQSFHVMALMSKHHFLS
jgi:hypothetical protein